MTDEVHADEVHTDEGSSAAPGHPTLRALAEAFPSVGWEEFRPPAGPYQPIAHVDRGDLVAFLTAARDAGFETFVDLCGVDHLGRRPRFEVVIGILSIRDRLRLRIRVPVPGDDPVVPTITGVYAGANFYERETWDLFGIEFEGHPDLARLLLPDDWEGHPLRKDYGVGSVPVQFKAAHRVR
ncbi:MAG TPA: NADH-quinone oxidoreductase subunit C [Actinobacteria bacterium]|nr:NADH-quinone oxidoreductase subunit C [Actinomycetota bacterium]